MSKNFLKIDISNEQELYLFAKQFVHLLEQSLQQRENLYLKCFYLYGELGAGKTTFVRAIVHAISEEKLIEVNSPTYTLAHHYPTLPPVVHMDLYRLKKADEVHSLGLLDGLPERAWLLIEWPEILEEGEVLFEDRFEIHFESGSEPTTRALQIRGFGVFQGLLEYIQGSKII